MTSDPPIGGQTARTESASDREDIDARLGWIPIRDVPRRFQTPLEDAQAALARWDDDNRTEDLEQVARIWGGIVEDGSFERAPVRFRIDLLNRSAIALEWLAQHNRDLRDGLETPIRRWLLALDLAPPDWPERARYRFNLGTAYHLRFSAAGAPEDLAAAAETMQEAVEAVPRNDPALRALALTGASEVFGNRHRMRGDPDDLRRAITWAEEATDLARAPRVAHRARSILSVALCYRYDAFGAIDDLKRAIDLRENNVASEAGRSERTSNEAMLGALLRRRWTILRDPRDLDRAIDLIGAAATEPDAPDGPARLTNLGNALLDRYDVHGQTGDLTQAAEVHEQAVLATESGDWQLHSRQNNAGNSSLALYEATGDDQALTRAIAHYRASIRGTSDTAPELASRHYNLGRALMATTVAGVDRGTPEAVAGTFRAACVSGLRNALEWALAASRTWGEWAVARGAWDEAAAAYAFAGKAIDQLFRRQLERDEKETWLQRAQGLPAQSAFALAIAGDPAAAITALERGRAFLLSETLERDTAQLSQIEATGRPDLARRYREISRLLRQSAQAEAIRDARAELNAVIAEIQSIPGHESFLEPPEFPDIARAAGGKPLVFLAAAPRGGLALVATDEATEPEVLPMPEMTEEEVARRARALLAAHTARGTSPAMWAGTIDAVGAWLWRVAMGPLLEAVEGAERAVLVPAGILGVLPLHAAWTRAAARPTGRLYAIDKLALSYVPNARSLAAARAVAGRSDADSALFVDDPQPVDAGPVPGSGIEVAAARRYFARAVVLGAGDATREAVLRGLEDFGVLHLACHGFAVPASPLDSALVLAGNEPLSLRDVLAVRRPREHDYPRLALLSACEASRPGDSLPDEVVSLPSGLLQAGLAGVVASQWAVDGPAATMLMARFYERWRIGGMEPGTALRDAQCWLRDTSNGEKAAWFREQVKEGPQPSSALRSLWREAVRKDPGSRSHAGARYWAAFAHVGV